MTHSSMLQSLPAPLQSLLREPTALTILASIGIHGVLWAVLPYVPLTGARPTEADIRREVGLVELSPDELARVPQAASQSSQPIPAAPLPSNNAGRLPQQYSLTPLPSPPPPQFPSVLPPSFYIPPPARLPLLIPPTAIRPRSTIPTTPRRPTLTPTPTPTPAPTSQASPTPQPSPTSQASPTPTPTSLPDEDPLQNVPPLDNAGEGRTPNQNPTPSPTETSSPNNGNATGQASPTPTPTPIPTSTPNQRDQQERDRIIAATTPYPEGSVPRSQNEAIVASGRWFYEGNEGRTPSDLRSADIAGRYPRIACRLQRSARVAYGVNVDAEDRIVGNPQLLLSSGYPVFDEAALAAVRRYNFNNTTSEEQPYQVNITFTYNRDVCPPSADETPPS